VTVSVSATAQKMEQDGFVLLDDVLDDTVPPDVLQLLSAGCDELIERSRSMTKSTDDWQLEAPGEGGGWAARAAGEGGVGGKLRVVGKAHLHSAKFAEAERLLRLRERYVEPLHDGPTYLGDCFLWAKPGEIGSQKPWHQDLLFPPEGFLDDHIDILTIWIAIDDAHEGNGCLQMLPGSHRDRRLEEPDGKATDLFESPVEPSLDIARLWPDLTPLTVPRPAGTAVMFSGFMAHTSARNSTAEDRRAVSFVYPLVRW
jgi:2-oxoglutarate-dependent dioxygenase